MITINLDSNSVEDFKAIQELKAMGISDEQIQKWYDKSKKGEKPNEREQGT